MPGYQDLLSGFSQRKAEVEQQNYDRSMESSAMEQKLFSSLLGSDDPEIQQLAMTGLLDSANPKKRKKGLSGWLGELEQSPHLAAMKALINTPVQEQRQINLPGEAQGISGPPTGLQTVKPTIQQTPGANPAAMSATSLVDQKVDAGPPAPTTYTQQPPIPYTVQRPRQVFLPPDEKAYRSEMAQVSAEVEGDKMRVEAGMAPRWGVRAGTAGAAGSTYAEGNVVPDPDSPTGFSQDLYLRSDPTKRQRIPAQDPTKSTTRFFGQDLESLSTSAEFGGLPFAQQPPAVKARIVARKQQLEVSQAGSVTTARENAQAAAPMDRQQTFAAHQTLTTDWQELAKPLREVTRQMSIMDAGMAAAKAGNVAAGTDAVQLTFQKILDPISVVRTEEYLRIVGEQSLLDRVKGAFERVKIGGTGVPLSELQEYADLAHQVATAMDRGMEIDRRRIARTARTYGLDPSLILDRVPPESAAPASTTANPPPAPTGATPRAATTGATTAGQPQVGDTVMYQGKRYKVAGVTNGQADLELIP